MVSFRGQKKLGPRPDRTPLGASFKIIDEHPHPFHVRSPPTPGFLPKKYIALFIFTVSILNTFLMFMPAGQNPVV